LVKKKSRLVRRMVIQCDEVSTGSGSTGSQLAARIETARIVTRSLRYI